MLDVYFYTLSEAATLTGQNKETLKKKCQEDKIKGVKKIANRWLIPKEYVRGFETRMAGAYFDGANMLHGGLGVGWLLDYKKVLEFTKRKYDLKIISFYDSIGFEFDEKGQILKDKYGKLVPKESHVAFFNFLRGIGFRVVSKPLKFIDGDVGKPKNNMDGFINIDVPKESEQWDVLLLFSGDSDFERLVDEIISKGKQVLIFSFSKRLSYELRTKAFNSPLVSFTLLDDLKSILSKNPKKG